MKIRDFLLKVDNSKIKKKTKRRFKNLISKQN